MDSITLRHVRTSVLALAFLGCAADPPLPPVTTTAPPPVARIAIDCGPELAGADLIRAAPLVIFGEVHGQVGPPAIVGDFACRARATLALEIPATEQPRIDAFLDSNGGEPAKGALLAGEFWTRPFQDGRSSTAMLGLLEHARIWRKAGLPMRVVAIDDARAAGQQESEKQMASRLVALVRAKTGPVVMLVGNYHAHVAPGAPWDPKLEFMAAVAKKDVPDLVSLDIRAGEGEAWVCYSDDPNECGRKPSRSKETNLAPFGTITLFPRPDESGMSGTYSVGAAEAADPARGVKPEQEASALVFAFRAANRPKIVDDAPLGSVLSAEDRKRWCTRFTPFEARVARAGDRIEGMDCGAKLVPAAARQIVPDVALQFSVDFFFDKPYASASYDRETKTLFLPLASTYSPWDQIGATRHEWLHARHHAKARGGDPLAAALMSVSEGKDYRPDGFYFDEVPVNLCDVVRAASEKKGPSLEMAQQYSDLLQKELATLKTLKPGPLKTRAGVPGHSFAPKIGSRNENDGTERWVGGKDAAKSLALLESVAKEANTALTALKSGSVPPLAADCDPSK
jgi:hypothetical protein